MKTLSVDVAIIGHGTAGANAYRAARAHTDQIAIVNSGPYGTTCARVGCMPSKLLISAAESAHEIAHSSEFGIHVDGSLRIEGKEVMRRVREMRDFFVGFVLEGVESIPGKHRIVGRARFLDPHTLQVDDHTRITAKSVVIATGSSTVIPEFLQDLGDRLVTNEDVFYWEDLPESLAVFGTGVIGLELGQAFHRLGVKTTVFGRSGRIGPFTDPELKAYARKTFEDDMDLVSQPQILFVETKNMGKTKDLLSPQNTSSPKDSSSVHIRFKDTDGNERMEEYEYVLAASGRFANVAHLGLENAGIELDKRGVPVFDPHTMQCGGSHIFIAGDATQDLPILHEASDEGKIAGKNAALFPHVNQGKRTTPFSVVFVDPQMAMMGTSFRDLEEGSFVIGRVNFEQQGRSRVMRKNKGLLHVYADKTTGKLLGAEMFGPRAENIGHLLAWCIEQNLTVAQILEMPFYHPVIEEGVRTAFRDAQQQINS